MEILSKDRGAFARRPLGVLLVLAVALGAAVRTSPAASAASGCLPLDGSPRTVPVSGNGAQAVFTLAWGGGTVRWAARFTAPTARTVSGSKPALPGSMVVITDADTRFTWRDPRGTVHDVSANVSGPVCVGPDNTPPDPDYPKPGQANAQYSGRRFPQEQLGELAAKYPEGVWFTREGFPIFTPYAIKAVRLPGGFRSRAADKAAANRLAGYPTFAGATPPGYTWHHKEDGVTMELIPRDLHDRVKHFGGYWLMSQDRGFPSVTYPPGQAPASAVSVFRAPAVPAGRESVKGEAALTAQKLKYIPGWRASEGLVRHVEIGVGIELPEDYRSWLLDTSGGDVAFPYAFDEDGSLDLERFYGPSEIVDNWKKGWNSSISGWWLPVGGGGGVILCLGVQDITGAYGKVAAVSVDKLQTFTSTGELEDGGLTLLDEDMEPLADSWTEFLEKYKATKVRLGDPAEPGDLVW